MINPNEAIDLLDRSGIVLIIWSTEPEVSALFISDNIRQFGYEPTDFYEGEFTNYWNFVHEEDRERARTELYLARQKARNDSSNSFTMAYRVRCKNGEVRWVEETLLYDHKDGEVSERGFLRDITSTANVVTHLREAVEKHNHLFDHVSELIFVINRQDRILSANSRFVHFTGLNVEDSVEELSKHGNATFYEFIADMGLSTVMEFFGKEDSSLMRVEAKMLLNGDLLVVAENIGELEALKSNFEYMKMRDVPSGLLNQNALESFVQNCSNETGYRVVMAKVVDYKNQVQLKGFSHAEFIAAKVAAVITTEFSMYDDNIFRSFEDEYVIFTRSPVNNIHIYNTNKKLEPEIKLEWGVSKRGINLRELLNDARCNFKEYVQPLPAGSIFGFTE